MDGKTKAIVSHITLIGWVVALILNNSEKEEIASYYIRQQLGLMLACIALSLVFGIVGVFIGWVPVIGWIIGLLLGLLHFASMIAITVFWVMSLIGAINGEEKPTPWVGAYFQDWFKAL